MSTKVTMPLTKISQPDAHFPKPNYSVTDVSFFIIIKFLQFLSGVPEDITQHISTNKTSIRYSRTAISLRKSSSIFRASYFFIFPTKYTNSKATNLLILDIAFINHESHQIAFINRLFITRKRSFHQQ